MRKSAPSDKTIHKKAPKSEKQPFSGLAVLSIKPNLRLFFGTSRLVLSSPMPF
jgi:hypothetical protein